MNDQNTCAQCIRDSRDRYYGYYYLQGIYHNHRHFVEIVHGYNIKYFRRQFGRNVICENICINCGRMQQIYKLYLDNDSDDIDDSINDFVTQMYGIYCIQCRAQQIRAI